MINPTPSMLDLQITSLHMIMTVWLFGLFSFYNKFIKELKDKSIRKKNTLLAVINQQ
jgi:hypothetical protein